MESKNILEKIIGDEVSIFVYPEGKSDDDLYKICKNGRYEYGLSIKHKSNNPFCIGRVNVRNYQ